MKKKIIISLLLLATLTGCTQPLKNSDNKAVVHEATGQNLTKNILCQPTNEEVNKLYKENGVAVESLPKCEELQIYSGEYDGVWSTIFIKPLAWSIVKVGTFVGNYGLAIILIGILIRVLLIPVTKKTAMQSENMKKAKPELSSLETKYKDKSSQEEQMKKTQEMMAIYKKYNINPMLGCLFAFIQLPLLIAFLEAINRVPAIFENNFLTYQLGTSPLVGLGNSNFSYLILIALIALTTYYSFKLSSASADTDPTMASSMKYMSVFMIIFITATSFTFPSAVCLYWIATSLFTIIQNILVKRETNAK